MAILALLLFFSSASDAPLPNLSADEIVQKMIAAESTRKAEMPAYSAVRKYSIDNARFHKYAEMTVSVLTEKGGKRQFRVLSETGPGFLRTHVLKRILEAEEETNNPAGYARVRISPENYSFKLVGPGEYWGKPAYILELEPKRSYQYLVRGRIWVLASDFSVVQVQGRPAKRPSFWLSNIWVSQFYELVGQYWLSQINNSSADVRWFGPTKVTIQYSDYKLPAQ